MMGSVSAEPVAIEYSDGEREVKGGDEGKMPYSALDHRFWTSPTVRALTDDEKLVFAYLLTCPHSNMLGLYRMPIPYLAHDLGWPLAKAKKALGRLSEESSESLIQYDANAELVYIPNYLKYNTLASGNRERGAMARLKELPDTPLLQSLVEAVETFAPTLKELRKALRLRLSSESLGRVLEESLYTDSDADADADADAVVVPESIVKADEVIDYLNEVTDSRFQHSDASRENIHARLKEGATLEDCRMVIDHKSVQWLGDPKWEQYLRPKTLFAPTKFEANLNAAIKWVEQGRPEIGTGKGKERRDLQRTREWAGGG